MDERIDDSLVTAHAGVPLVIELFRATGAAGVLDGSVKIKSRKRGLAASEMAESLFALWASGGERCEDLRQLRGDAALAALSGKFGANAAWFRLNVICYNLISLFKRETLPGEFWTAKPKKSRFVLLNTVGKVIRHAGKTMLRLMTEAIRTLFDGSRRKIPLPAPA